MKLSTHLLALTLITPACSGAADPSISEDMPDGGEVVAMPDGGSAMSDASEPMLDAPNLGLEECEVGEGFYPCAKAIAYGSDPEQLYDIYLPVQPDDAVEDAPLVIWVHGGGYFQGDREDALDMPHFRPQDYLDMGMAVATVDYRLSGQHPFSPTSGLDLPPAMADVGRALQHMRFADESFKIDKQKVVLAGAYLQEAEFPRGWLSTTIWQSRPAPISLANPPSPAVFFSSIRRSL